MPGKRLSDGNDVGAAFLPIASAELLNDRRSVYERAAALIERAVKVLDTTWGIDPVKLNASEQEASGLYLDAKRAAIARNVDYHEIFTSTKSKRRLSRIEEAVELAGQPNNYRARRIGERSIDVPLIDFIVVNDRFLILSFLSTPKVCRGCQYLYLDSTAAAGHFTEYFSLCWERGRDVGPTNSVNAVELSDDS